jgi:hypothetical protein
MAFLCLIIFIFFQDILLRAQLFLKQESNAFQVSTLSQIPKGVWVVGGVSMLMDISSEIFTACCHFYGDHAGTSVLLSA